MPDPIALRVAARFRQAGPASQDQLTKDIEQNAYKARNILKAIHAEHERLDHGLFKGAPAHEVDQIFHKIHPLIVDYETALKDAMAAHDELSHIKDAEERAYDTGHRMAGEGHDEKTVNQFLEIAKSELFAKDMSAKLVAMSHEISSFMHSTMRSNPATGV